MTVKGKAMTAEELLRLPDEACRHELIKGELITMTPAGFGPRPGRIVRAPGPIARGQPSSDALQTLSVHDTLDGGDVVPGFRLPVVDIFGI